MVVATLIPLSMLAACDGEKEPAKPPAQLMYRAGDGQSSLMDRTSGTFEVHAGCLFLVTDKGKRYLPVFPREITRWDGDTLVMGSGRMHLDQPITAGGGAVDAVSAAVFKRPAKCPAKTPVWILDAATHAK